MRQTRWEILRRPRKLRPPGRVGMRAAPPRPIGMMTPRGARRDRPTRTVQPADGDRRRRPRAKAIQPGNLGPDRRSPDRAHTVSPRVTPDGPAMRAELTWRRHQTVAGRPAKSRGPRRSTRSGRRPGHLPTQRPVGPAPRRIVRRRRRPMMFGDASRMETSWIGREEGSDNPSHPPATPSGYHLMRAVARSPPHVLMCRLRLRLLRRLPQPLRIALPLPRGQARRIS